MRGCIHEHDKGAGVWILPGGGYGYFIAMFVIGVVKTNLDIIPVAQCLTALCTITGGYIGFQTVNNGVKGKYWNQQMCDSEHKLEEKI